MARPSGDHRPRHIVVLAFLGVVLFVAGIALRYLDRPLDVDPVDSGDATSAGQFFSVGMDEGSFEELSCSTSCPNSLLLQYDSSDPELLVGKLLGTLTGRQAGTDPARIVLVTPGGTSDVTLLEETDPQVTMSTEVVRAGGAESVATVLTVPAIDTSLFFGVDFLWRPDDALIDAGIGRRKLRMAYTKSHPAFDGAHAYSLDIAEVDASLRTLGVEFDADRERIAEAAPDPDGRPKPRSVLWEVGTAQPDSYFVVTIDDATARFLVGLLNEQTLFVAGLLLGAVIGAKASVWLTGRNSG
ncbi:hypothetical protein [Actinoplanes sp. RD1]|uniref:hypothetical protein n=1 Tax=Actinoplanes sp. RD1 TaxID=3064538 RepID=UPI0027415185|nr:hypothetical protein [Actinoplanes sp. RD1]